VVAVVAVAAVRVVRRAFRLVAHVLVDLPLLS
jgi:hypothetical protein